ncbi:transglycosylase SLT domain-containing protein [Nitrospira sp. KM1]|uniref:transglycosylase SLT domain-containing protein n=1 Tax=Nitrospira sp. KM1 TaxID=1936990 RepID=UPI001E4F2149|nr:transglycosylase SLT domain-containing protein [Nitrospira sp. KM1]
MTMSISAYVCLLARKGRRTSIGLLVASFLIWGCADQISAEIYQYVGPNGTISLTNVPSDARYRRFEMDAAQFPSVISERELEPLIRRHSTQQQLHPALIRAVIKAESNFDPRAVSRAGAIGLMQLMPQTAIRMDVRDLYDPEDNVAGGTRYLRQLLDRFHGNLPLALAAYNAGESVVERYQALPPIAETRQYVKKVLRYYRTFLVRDGVITERPISRYAPARSVAAPETSEIVSR